MFPVFDVVQSAKLGVKVSIFLGLLAYFHSQIDSIVVGLNFVFDKAFSFLDAVPSLEFGCFLTKIGFTSFINSLLDSLYTAMGLYMTSLITVFTYTFGIKMFGIFMRV